MAGKIIRQSVTVAASPHEVYEVLLDSRKHARLTGGPAKISRKVGGAHSAFDGYATGVNLMLTPDEKIVQTWRASDWPDGASSQVSYSLKAVKGGTRLSFSHRGVPAEHVESIRQGWIEHYWTPLKATFVKRAT